jgi:hypothetical protein
MEIFKFFLIFSLFSSIYPFVGGVVVVIYHESLFPGIVVFQPRSTTSTPHLSNLSLRSSVSWNRFVSIYAESAFACSKSLVVTLLCCVGIPTLMTCLHFPGATDAWLEPVSLHYLSTQSSLHRGFSRVVSCFLYLLCAIHTRVLMVSIVLVILQARIDMPRACWW